jgi:hypothetical protein
MVMEDLPYNNDGWAQQGTQLNSDDEENDLLEEKGCVKIIVLSKQRECTPHIICLVKGPQYQHIITRQ